MTTVSTKKQRCYIYTRVSTSMQVDGYSLDAQRERLKREAAHRDMLVVGEFSDEGKSGKNISGRPEFTEMMRRIENDNTDNIDYVLVFKLSRFGRNADDVLHELRIMQRYEIYDGEHEAIVSEEVWMQAYIKRQQFGGRREKKHSLEHEHLLSGILRCPVCGAAMYGSVNRKKKKDGTYYKDSFYYVCKHRKMVDGRTCSFRFQPPQDRINAEVEALVIDAWQSPVFLETIQNRLNQTIDEGEIKARIAAQEKAKS